MFSPTAPAVSRTRRSRSHRPATRLEQPVAIALALGLLAFGANMASPLYPGYQARLGFDDLTLTLIYAAYAVASVPALLVLGPLGDQIGRTRLVRGGLLVAMAGSACFAIGSGVQLLLLGRALQGVALGAATGAGMAVLAEAATVTHRRRFAATGALAFLAGTAAGPGLTGVLAELVPAPHVTVHIVHVLALVAVFWRLGAAPVPVTGSLRWSSPRPQLPVRGRHRYLVAMLTGFVSWAVVGVFLGVVPSVVVRGAGDVGTTLLGAVASAVVLAGLPAHFLVARLGTERAQLAGLGLLSGGLALLVGTAGSASSPVMLGAALVAGFGHGLAYGGAHAVVAATAVGPRAAGVTATAYVVYYLGAGVPAVLVGVLSPAMSLPGATSLLAGLTLAGAVVAATRVRAGALGSDLHRRRTAQDSAVSEIADLLRDMARGVHQANGIWHGAPPTARAGRPGPPGRARSAADPADAGVLSAGSAARPW